MGLVRGNEPGLDRPTGDQGCHGGCTQPLGGSLADGSGIHVRNLVFLLEPLWFVMRPGCLRSGYAVLTVT